MRLAFRCDTATRLQEIVNAETGERLQDVADFALTPAPGSLSNRFDVLYLKVLIRRPPRTAQEPAASPTEAPSETPPESPRP